MRTIDFYFYPLISSIGVKATAGSEPTLQESTDVFPSGILGLPLPVQPEGTRTRKTSCSSYQLIREGKFCDFFSVLGEGRTRWEERQLVKFCREYSWLRHPGRSSFFEIIGGYVALVSLTARELKIEIMEFACNVTWSGQTGLEIYQLK